MVQERVNATNMELLPTRTVSGSRAGGEEVITGEIMTRYGNNLFFLAPTVVLWIVLFLALSFTMCRQPTVLLVYSMYMCTSTSFSVVLGVRT
jgi:predicted RND superfamily exporter protein